MPTTRIPHVLMPLVLASLLPLAAPPASAKNTRIGNEISADLAEARDEVRAELAAARRELETDNLQLGDNLHFSKSGKRVAATTARCRKRKSRHGATC
jgi:hypothetical protein